MFFTQNTDLRVGWKSLLGLSLRRVSNGRIPKIKKRERHDNAQLSIGGKFKADFSIDFQVDLTHSTKIDRVILLRSFTAALHRPSI